MFADVLENTGVITITPAAGQKVRDLLISKNVPDYGLRVFISGGGCSGMQYGMALEAEARPYDNVLEGTGFRVFVDPTSMMYLENAVIDFEDNIMGGGFKIENPNAAASCGCGTSFKPKNGEATAAGAGCGCGSGGCG
ncbi:MAG: iron-sulfur cluster assembly accessory protein [Chloroflexi bacterium]|nr:iron-sulfur cluster assembly accessory protein [Chloroflexota bacterium]MDA0245714.1 iron-sulfur cluster assembly accessory protein [Chloroflexota bacterium]